MTARVRVGWFALAYLAFGWIVFAADLVVHGPLLRNAFALFCMLVASAIAAGADTPLGLLNFVLLQWFGVRLARSEYVVARYPDCRVGERMVLGDARALRFAQSCRVSAIHGSTMTVRWYSVQRWIVPLTGWWSDYRWIVRRR